MAGSGGNAVVPTTADLSEALEQGVLGNRATQTDHAALIGVDSTTLVGTGATVQAVLEELDNAIVAAEVADAAHTADTLAAHDGTAVLLDSTNLLVGVGVNAQTVAQELDTEAITARTYRPLYSSLAADSAEVNASEALVASGLTVTLAAGTYEFETVVLVTTAAAADTRIKFDGTATITGTIGVSDVFYVAGPHEGSDGTVAAIPVLLPTSWTTAFVLATTGALADTPLVFKGRVVCTVAGTFVVQFAQGTSNASNTHVDKGSYLVARRVA